MNVSVQPNLLLNDLIFLYIPICVLYIITICDHEVLLVVT